MEQNWESRNRPKHQQPVDFGQGCQEHSVRKKTVSSATSTRTIGQPQAKQWGWTPNLTLYVKTNPKWINDLWELKTIELLEENRRANHHDFRFGHGFDSKSRITTKINTLNFTKMKTFYASKDIIKDVKRQSAEWKKISTNHFTLKWVLTHFLT